MTELNAHILAELERAIAKRERIIARACSAGVGKPPLAARIATTAIDYAKRAILGHAPTSLAIALKSLEEFNKGTSE